MEKVSLTHREIKIEIEKVLELNDGSNKNLKGATKTRNVTDRMRLDY